MGVWTLGLNSNGQGGGNSTLPRTFHTRVLEFGRASVAASRWTAGHVSLAVLEDGTLWAWGTNGDGEVGDGTRIERVSPVQVLTGVEAIACGERHGLAITAGGVLRAWGEGLNGRLGTGNVDDQLSPVVVPLPVPTLKIAAGRFSSMAILEDGSLWGWGAMSYGRLGNGETTGSSNDPINASAVTPLPAFVDLACGYYHGLALDINGTLYAWGRNNRGQIGDVLPSTTATPSIISLPPLAAVSAGDLFSLALSRDGRVFAWGENHRGQLGRGTVSLFEGLPLFIPALNGSLAISAGTEHALAIGADGSMWGWGGNDEHEISPNSGSAVSTPMMSEYVTGVVDLVAGTEMSIIVGFGVVITSSAPPVTSVSPFRFTVTFSADVVGFSTEDVNATNGAVEEFAGSGSVYTFSVVPADQGTVVVDFAHGAATHTGGFPSARPEPFVLYYDAVAPTVTITSPARPSSPTYPLPFVITFSEPVVGFESTAIGMSGGAILESFMEEDAMTYTFNAKPASEGPVVVSVPAGVAWDAAGFANDAAEDFVRVYDTVAPSVILRSDAANPTSSTPISFTATFSETVFNFSASSVSVSAGFVSLVAGAGAVYTFEVTPSRVGSLVVTVPNGVVEDNAGFLNSISAPYDIAYTCPMGCRMCSAYTNDLALGCLSCDNDADYYDNNGAASGGVCVHGTEGCADGYGDISEGDIASDSDCLPRLCEIGCALCEAQTADLSAGCFACDEDASYFDNNGIAPGGVCVTASGGCAPGFFNVDGGSLTSATSCQPCTVGCTSCWKESTDLANGCATCDTSLGYFDNNGQDAGGSCVNAIGCASGYINALGAELTSNNDCIACDAGSYSSAGECRRCPAGHISARAVAQCSLCPPGSYSSRNRTMCATCPQGTAGNGTGSCHICPSNQGARPASSSCGSCDTSPELCATARAPSSQPAGFKDIPSTDDLVEALAEQNRTALIWFTVVVLFVIAICLCILAALFFFDLPTFNKVASIIVYLDLVYQLNHFVPRAGHPTKKRTLLGALTFVLLCIAIGLNLTFQLAMFVNGNDVITTTMVPGAGDSTFLPDLIVVFDVQGQLTCGPASCDPSLDLSFSGFQASSGPETFTCAGSEGQCTVTWTCAGCRITNPAMVSVGFDEPHGYIYSAGISIGSAREGSEGMVHATVRPQDGYVLSEQRDMVKEPSIVATSMYQHVRSNARKGTTEMKHVFVPLSLLFGSSVIASEWTPVDSTGFELRAVVTKDSNSVRTVISQRIPFSTFFGALIGTVVGLAGLFRGLLVFFEAIGRCIFGTPVADNEKALMGEDDDDATQTAAEPGDVALSGVVTTRHAPGRTESEQEATKV